MEFVKSIYDLAAALVFFGAVGAYVATCVVLLISLSRLFLKPEKSLVAQVQQLKGATA